MNGWFGVAEESKLDPNSEVPRLGWKTPLTWLATLTTLSPRERVARCRRFYQPERAG